MTTTPQTDARRPAGGWNCALEELEELVDRDRGNESHGAGGSGPATRSVGVGLEASWVICSDQGVVR